MTGAKIKALRGQLGETTDQFGGRFHRSGRTVEDWEQGRRNPDPVVISLLNKLENRLQKKLDKSGKNVD